MTRGRIIPGLALALALLAPSPAPAVDQVPSGGAVAGRPRLDIDVWVNKDEGGVYRPGESMRIYFRTNADAYVLLYNIDTDGYIHLIYPYGPTDPAFVPGGRTHVVPSRRDPYELVADGPPGVEYVVALASPVPLGDLPWYLSDADQGGPPPPPEEDSDALDQGYVVGDPYVAMEHLNHRIVPAGHDNDMGSSDTYFYIDRRVDYPRYVCADCHYHQPFFDPYGAVCPVVDIRVDATWVHYAPVRWGAIRPRYYYIVRSTAPVRYRQLKRQWSSVDGPRLLRRRFVVSHEARGGPVPRLRTRAKARQYFDLRRIRHGRIWQGRDEVLRLRQQREQLQRRRQEIRQELRDRTLRRDRGQGSRDGRSKNPPAQTRERRTPDKGQSGTSREERARNRGQSGGSRDERAHDRQNREEQRGRGRSQDRGRRGDDSSNSRGRGR